MPILLPVLVRRSMRDTTVAAVRARNRARPSPLGRTPPRTCTFMRFFRIVGIVIERMAGEEEADRVVFALQQFAPASSGSTDGNAQGFTVGGGHRTIRSGPTAAASCVRVAVDIMVSTAALAHRRSFARACRRRRRPRGFPARAC